MSSELDKLVEVITDLVLAELDEQAEVVVPQPVTKAVSASGTRVLICPGPGEVEPELWKAVSSVEGLSPSALVWNGFRGDQLPSGLGWGLEARSSGWAKVVSGYRGVVLLGADLSVLAALGNLGSGGLPSASVAVAALSAGIPVFIDDSPYEKVRRHSSRLASGFVRRFEEFYRLVSSFGVEFGGTSQVANFLTSLGPGAVAAPAGRSGGRAVVTVEDVEAVRRSGQSRLPVALGTIITPLAAQRASEWGIEVAFQ